jgi:hypothetical protein
MANLSTLQGWLTDAEAALHQLNIGAQVVEVEHGDMKTTYTKADLSALRAYIGDLKAQIVAAGGTVDTLRRRGIAVDLP